MKIFSYPFLLCILFFAACSSTDNYQLEVDLRNSTYDHAYLYGFMGEKQILIDSIPIYDGKILYNIENKCNKGVYRLLFDNNTFIDFIYTNEKLKISADANDVFATSEDNASYQDNTFFNFSKEISNIHAELQGEISQETLDSLSNEYFILYNKYSSNKELQNTFFQEIINLLFLPDYTIYKAANKNTSITEDQYLLENYFAYADLNKEELLATPYFYLAVNSYLQLFEGRNDSLFIEASEQLMKKASQNINVNNFLTNTISEIAFQQKRTQFFKTYNQYKNACIKEIDDSFFSKLTLSPGCNLENLLPEHDTSSTYSLYCFTDKNCPRSNNLVNLLTEKDKYFKKNNITVVKKNTGDSCLLDKINIFVSPTIIVIDSKGNYISKWQDDLAIEFIKQLN